MPAVAEIRRAAPQPLASEPAGSARAWLFPALGVASLVVSCVLWSLKRQMWGDEVFSWTELGDSSLGHLLHAVVRLGGAGMPLYYLLGWPWAHLFGRSDLSLRLFSCAGICGAFLVMIAALRRRLGMRAAFLGVGFGLFASLLVVEQNCEARDYGLYLLLASLAVAQLLKVAETPRPAPRMLSLLALSQAGLVLGHVLGMIYGGLLLAALIAADAWQRQFRPKVYLCCMAGWLALVPWIPAIQSSIAVGRPHGWNPMPGIGDLLIGCSFWLFGGLYWQVVPHSAIVALLACWLAAVLCVGFLVATGIRHMQRDPRRRPMVLIALALLAAPALFVAISHIVAPIFVPRYMLPSALGVALLAAVAFEGTRLMRERMTVLLSCGVLFLPIGAAMLARPANLDVTALVGIANGQPVVCDSQKDFLVMTRYRPGSARYPMDFQALAQGSGGPDQRLMENYLRQGYFPGDLPDLRQVLAEQRFLLLDNTESDWFQRQIASNPLYRWKDLAQIDPQRSLIAVERAQ